MRILTGIDLTMEDHDWILKPSIQIAVKLDAQIDLIYVMAGAETSKVAHNLSQLQALLAPLPKQIQGQVICEPGTVVSGLVDRADKYDMIVIGPREPGPLERILRGPVAARVVQRTSKPVLIPRLEHKPYRKRCKLLVGIDLQGPDHQRLLRLAGDWAKHTSGTVDGVYVEPNRLPYISDSRVRAAAERDWEAARQPIRLQLQEMMAQVVEEPHRGEALMAWGEPEAALIKLSESFDLVVVGSLPRKGLAGYILGSVATNVLRGAHCDVLALTAQ